ncbi:hypothetical protein D3C78_1608180 [compost metagenome]
MKPFEPDFVDARADVVVALDHRDLGAIAEVVDHLVVAIAVHHQVAQADQPIDAQRLQAIEHAPHGGEIPVDVGQDADAHAVPSP